jgi:ABC-type Zn uptake system ZnuABC Zn-binding protein ZnuA
MQIPRVASRPAIAALTLAGVLASSGAAGEPLRVVASVPDLADLARQVGGDDVDVTALVQGRQDPHSLEPRPSFIRALHDADLFVVQGMELEVGWAPTLLESARNPRATPGGVGYLDASLGLAPLEVPPPGATRALGDVHPFGNPHYLTDPLNGLRAAALLRDRLAELRPERAAAFRERYLDFAHRLLERLVGAELAAGRDPDELAREIEADPDGFLGPRAPAGLGGWLAAVRPVRGTKAAEEHQYWAYFAHRFGVVLVARLEPFPGIAPTTRHLAEVVALIQAERVPIVLTSGYFDPRHARWVAERTGARIVPLAHQAGARPGVDDYLSAVDYNVRTLVEALGAGVAPAPGAQP